MPTIRYSQGQQVITLNKSEVSVLRRATMILLPIAHNEPGHSGTIKQTCESIEEVVKLFGSKHA
jgi:hypothetical protein